MFYRLHVFPFRITHRQLGSCRAEVFGKEGGDGLWRGWLVFAPDTTNLIIVAGPETTQPTRDALVYWAIGLDPVHYQIALERALRARLRAPGALDGPAFAD